MHVSSEGQMIYGTGEGFRRQRSGRPGTNKKTKDVRRLGLESLTGKNGGERPFSRES